MKTLEDFKGTSGNIETDKFANELYLVEVNKTDTFSESATICIFPYDTVKAQANAKLFANSYKLLDSAINAHKAVMEGSEYGTKIHALNRLQEAIQDCL